MYTCKEVTGVTGGMAVGLAETGVSASFWILSAVVLVVVGATLYRLGRSRPGRAFLKD